MTSDTPENEVATMLIDLQILGDRLASLTPSEAAELSRCLERNDGFDSVESLVPVGPRCDEGGAPAVLEGEGFEL